MKTIFSERQILTHFFCSFIDKSYELEFDNRILKYNWVVKILSLFTFLFSIVNLVLFLTITHNQDEILNEISCIILVCFSFLCLILHFLAKEARYCNVVLYLEFILLSLNNFQFSSQLGLLHNLGRILPNSSDFIIKKDFLILFLDFLFILIWIITPLNNFTFLLFSNIIKICVLSCYFTLNKNFDQNMYEMYFICYVIGYLIITIISREIMKIKKQEFNYKKLQLKGEEGNSIIFQFNSCYVKMKNNEILEKNNFFEKEKQFLRFLLREKTRGLNDEFFHIEENVQSLTNNECEEIIKIIFLNLKINDKVHNTFPERQKTQEFKLYDEDQQIEQAYIKIPNLCTEQIKLNFKSKPIIETQIKKSNTLDEEILEYIMLNKSKFSSFSLLGKSVIIKGADKILSLEILVRVNNFDTIELILNDVTKSDISKGTFQFVMKTSQFLHDFKNPLICINNEISELKQVNKKLIQALCKKDNSNFISEVSFDSKSITIYDDCLLHLEKFEYIKQMSEYCQNMIGSYEDFSKNIFKPQSLKISIHNFDLIVLLKFIDQMMQVKLYHSNKNVKFELNTNNLNLNDKDTLFIGSDENKIKRVLINILSNSEKFTTVGTIILTVSKNMINEKKYIKFCIKDTGLGMSEEALKNLFTPFFSNNNIEINKNGVGLGLIIVKEITEKLGIGIQVTSEINKGSNSVFYIEDLYQQNYNLHSEPSSVETQIFKQSFLNMDNSQINNIRDLNKSNILDMSMSNDDEIKKIRSSKRHLTEKISGKSYLSDVIYAREISKLKHQENIIYNSPKTSLKYFKRGNSFNIYHSYTSNSNFIYDRSNKFLFLIIANEIMFEIGSIPKKIKRRVKVFGSECGGLPKNHPVKTISNNTLKQLSLFKNKTEDKQIKRLSTKKLSSCDLNHINLFENQKIVKRISDNYVHNNNSPKSSLRHYFENEENIIEFKRTSSKFLKNPNSDDSYSLNSIDVVSIDRKIISILIIDNDSSIRSFCKNSFKKVGEIEGINFTFDEADDGFTGLSQIFNKITNCTEFYDLIILDDIMSFLDGTDMFKILRYIKENDMSKVNIDDDNLFNRIILCSSDTDNVRSKVKFLRNERLCEKPMNLDFVKRVINNMNLIIK